MSQPCSAPQLILFDVDLFSDDASRSHAQAALTLVAGRGLPRGAVADHVAPAEQVEEAGAAAALDFWLPGKPGEWPFERALRLTGAEPERVVFVSAAPASRAAAERHGLCSCDVAGDDLERLLP